MRVLVTGATGALGGRVVRRLSDRGHRALVATREPDGPDHVFYSLAEPPSLPEVDAVVHLASDPRRPERDVAAMGALVAAGAAASLAHLVFISIVGIDGHPYPYYRAKLAQERAVAVGGVPWTILRSTQFHHFVPHLDVLFADGIPAGYRVQSVDAGAVAGRLVDLVEAGPSGRARDVGGPEVVDVATAVREARAASGRAGEVVVVEPADPVAEAFASGMGLLGADGEVIGIGYDEFVRTHPPA